MSEEIKINKRLDLKGEVCPYTFIKSKLVVEKMKIGDVIEIIVDYLPSVENVPRSLENEGQEILKVEQIAARDWRIIVRKKAES